MSIDFSKCMSGELPRCAKARSLGANVVAGVRFELTTNGLLSPLLCH